MRLRQVVAFLGTAAGVGLGVALATGPAAVADPTDTTSPVDVWPYGDFSGGLGGSGSVIAPDSTATITYDYNAIPTDLPWYTADADVISNTTYDVTKVIDPSAGTTVDQFQTLFTPFPNPTGSGDIFIPTISDPNVGTSDPTTLFASDFENFYVSDKAGIEDQVSYPGGQPMTVFDFPASDAPSTGAVSAPGDGFQQLLIDLGNGV